MLQTVERTLSVLELFRSSSELGIRDIARRLGISPTVVHRIVATLTAHGYLTQDGATRNYRLGPKVRELADMVSVSDTDVRRLALPHMRRLQDATGETVVLNTAKDGYRLILVEIESPSALRMVVPVQPFPILFGPATDQIFRAFSEPGTFDSEPPFDEDVPEIEREIQAGAADAPDLELVRERGWAVSYGVRIPGGISIAAPVITPAGLLAISIFGPSERIRERGVEQIAGEVVRAAAALSEALRAHESPGTLQLAPARPIARH